MDILNIRSQFPFLKLKPTPVYLDNAATTQKPQVVIDTISEYYTKHNGNPGRGNHYFARESSQILEESREKVAEYIGANSSQNIIFTSNTTQALNLLSRSLMAKLEPNDIVLTTQLEHHSNLAPWLKLVNEKGIRIEYIPVNSESKLAWTEKLGELKNEPVKIISIAHVSNVLGTILPVRKILERSKELWPKSVSIVDAAQSIAHIPVKIDHLKCDFLTFSGHKIYGPQGIGVLYGNKERLRELTPDNVGGGSVKNLSWESFEKLNGPAGFEAGTANVAAAAGLKTALDFMQQIIQDPELPNPTKTEQELAKYFINQLKNAKIPGLTIHGWPTNNPLTTLEDHIGLVSLSIEDVFAEDIANYLDTENIAVRAGRHCALPLHKEILKTDTSLRVSFGIYNTSDEVDTLIQALKSSLQTLS